MSRFVKCLESFPSGSFHNAALECWEAFFKIVPPSTDVAFWKADLTGGVCLSPRDSMANEFSPDWRIDELIILATTPLDFDMAEIYALDDNVAEEVSRKHYSWVCDGIEQSLDSPRFQALLAHRVSLRNEFAVVAATYDDGLLDTDFELIWTNTTGFGCRRIHEQQADVSFRSVRRVAKLSQPKKDGPIRED